MRERQVDEKSSLGGLTEREHDILTYLAEGKSHEEISKSLVISPKTVERHCENIMHKLNLLSRSELVRYGIRKGIIRREGCIYSAGKLIYTSSLVRASQARFSSPLKYA
jgi:DNA-binding NarL/FixJ family response regulator